jgi:hypothetical protein
MIIGKIKIPQKFTTPQEKVAKIFNKVCPDIKLAKSRIDKLKTRKTYETNSISTSKGAKATGAPGGKNKLKKCLRCFKIPKIFIPVKMAKAVVNVIIR